MNPREYIEAIAAELGKLRGRGLVLSSSDAQLALSWHASGVPVQAVLDELRKGERLRSRGASVRGAAEPGLSLQLFAGALAARTRVRAPARPAGETLSGQLAAAAAQADARLRAPWEALARHADDLLATGDAEGYWSAAIAALLSTLRALPRSTARKAGAALRERLAPRPRGMSRDRYRRSLQLMLLSASSESLGLPPRAFLL